MDELDAAALPTTELRAEDVTALDQMSTLELVTAMNREDQVAVLAVAAALPDVARLVDEAAARVRAGGTVHYVGAGTSGRLAFLDAAELLPTFNLEPGVVVAHIAGGHEALLHAVEDAEDDDDAGAAELAPAGPGDVVIGFAASGSTPYVGGALRAARARGAFTALVSCAANPSLAPEADLVIVADTGAEVLTGSTRLKAGTAQKLVLNAFSTALMVALGRTWSNLMVSVVATNAKLRQRSVRILAEATGLAPATARERLAAADGDLRVAIVAALADAEPPDARVALDAHHGSVREAIAALAATDPSQHHLTQQGTNPGRQA